MGRVRLRGRRWRGDGQREAHQEEEKEERGRRGGGEDEEEEEEEELHISDQFLPILSPPHETGLLKGQELLAKNDTTKKHLGLYR
ncbi:hypothetical protein PoB_003251700 [Plakobranchus ocellatus]|uniref:Uncharacterized protein n=1 Tax=Plakobranchus ocellatus TaxID=259542 RepID=A0AAV4AGI1_9GAST|nr:hypothetical protein PoB_003251700 [Plakobranchus ocellatus]